MDIGNQGEYNCRKQNIEGMYKMNRKYEWYMESEIAQLAISVMAVIPQDEKCCGVVQMVHGMCEYKERYIPFMEFLADHGYAAVIHDHRGHGKSIKNIQDLGYMYGGGANALIKDIKMVNDMIHEKFPKHPIIMFGHSMGSMAVRAFAANYDDKINALVVCGSPSYNNACSFGEGIARVEKIIRGKKHKSLLLEKISFGSYEKKFKDDKNCTAWICSDKKTAQEYEESEFCGFTFTDDGYIALFQLMKKAYDWKHWNCTNKELPILFISGQEDPCLGNVRKFAQAVKCMRKAGYYDVKGKLYKGMRHEILNETEKEKVYKDVLYYLKKKGF